MKRLIKIAYINIGRLNKGFHSMTNLLTLIIRWYLYIRIDTQKQTHLWPSTLTSPTRAQSSSAIKQDWSNVVRDAYSWTVAIKTYSYDNDSSLGTWDPCMLYLLMRGTPKWNDWISHRKWVWLLSAISHSLVAYESLVCSLESVAWLERDQALSDTLVTTVTHSQSWMG